MLGIWDTSGDTPQLKGNEMTRAEQIANASFMIGMESGKCGFYVDDILFEMSIEPAKSTALSADRAWDSVTLNGIHCGNRYGGYRTLLIMLGEREADYEFADRHAIAFAAEHASS